MRLSRLHPFPGVCTRFTLLIITALLFATIAHAQTYTLTTLADFQGNAHGIHPQSNVVFDRQGNLYGTTNGGGSAKGGHGTVYKIDAVTHTLTTVAEFSGGNGSEPCGRLVIDDQGSLYGTTLQGGVVPVGRPDAMGPQPLGTVFKVDTRTGKIMTLASFSTDPYIGQFPRGVTRDRHGNLYGTTQANAFGWPTLYKIAADTHTRTVLFPFRFAIFTPGKARGYPFTAVDGIPGPSVAVDDKGNLYGTLGRTTTFPCGAVYELKAHTNTPILLAAFTEANGISPDNLMISRTGDLYGTTHEGGAHHAGTVFKIKAGMDKVVTLTSLDSEVSSSPIYGVVSDSAGNVYGITRSNVDSSPDASSNHAGGRPRSDVDSSPDGFWVFKIAAGVSTLIPIVLTQGSGVPSSNVALTLDSRGNIYGVAGEGGPDGNGFIFKLTPTRNK